MPDKTSHAVDLSFNTHFCGIFNFKEDSRFSRQPSICDDGRLEI